jgi:hypothetical protein
MGFKTPVKEEPQTEELGEQPDESATEGGEESAVVVETPVPSLSPEDTAVEPEYPEEEALEASPEYDRDEVVTEPEDEILPEVDEEDEEEEEIVVKKKPKKTKAPPKHLIRIELDDEPLSDDDAYFFSDVLEEKETVSKPGTANGEKIETETVRPVIENQEESRGFTIGQLLAGEMEKKEKKGKNGKKGDK